MASVEARHLLLQMILKITVLKQNLNSRGGQGEKNVIFCYYFHHFFFHFIATIVTFAWKWRSNFILSSIYCRTAFCPLPWSFCWSLIIQKSLVKSSLLPPPTPLKEETLIESKYRGRFLIAWWLFLWISSWTPCRIMGNKKINL